MMTNEEFIRSLKRPLEFNRPVYGAAVRILRELGVTSLQELSALNARDVAAQDDGFLSHGGRAAVDQMAEVLYFAGLKFADMDKPEPQVPAHLIPPRRKGKRPRAGDPKFDNVTVTPAMVKAGLNELASNAEFSPGTDQAEVMARVFKAMATAKRTEATKA